MSQLGLSAVETTPGIVNLITTRLASRGTFQSLDQTLPIECQSDVELPFEFKDPTDIKEIAARINEISGAEFIIDRDVSGKVLIVNGKDKVTVNKACKIFVLALNQLGLGVRNVGQFQLLQASRFLKRDPDSKYVPSLYPSELNTAGSVEISYASPTDISQIAQDVQTWSGISFLLDRNVRGKVQILSQGSK